MGRAVAGGSGARGAGTAAGLKAHLPGQCARGCRNRVYPSVTPERYIFRVTIGSILGFCDARDEG